MGFLNFLTKYILKRVVLIFSIFSFITYITVPFLYNIIDYTFAQIIWYFSFILNLLFAIYITKYKPPFYKNPTLDHLSNLGIFFILILFFIFFINNYYSLPYWSLYRALCLFFIFWIPICILKCVKKSPWKHVIFYIFFDLFCLSLVENWLICQLVFGVGALLIIFYSCSLVFLSNSKVPFYFILQDFLIGIILTVYLIYIIPNKEIQDIVTTIVSTVYGGVFTLIGVVWAFQKGYLERTEEHRLSQKPYLFVQNVVSGLIGDPLYSWFYSENIKNTTTVYLGFLKNTDNGVAILKYIKTKNNVYTPHWLTVVDKGVMFRVALKKDINDTSNDFILVLEDVLGNVYSYVFEFDQNTNKVVGLNEIKSC